MYKFVLINKQIRLNTKINAKKQYYSNYFSETIFYYLTLVTDVYHFYSRTLYSVQSFEINNLINYQQLHLLFTDLNIMILC